MSFSLTSSAPPIFDSAEKTVNYLTAVESENITFRCDARSLQNEEEAEPPTWYINAHPYIGEYIFYSKTNK